MTTVYIQDIAQHAGETVSLKGWLADKTDKGRLQFLRVRDGTGLIQATVFEKSVSAEVFQCARSVTQESALAVSGEVRAEPRAPGGYELAVSDLQIVQFEKIRETAFRPWAANTIPRRFCSGIVEISDGSKRVIHYSIAEDTGVTAVYLGPQINFTWGDKLSAHAAVDLPMSIDNTSLQTVPDYRVRAGVTWHF